MKHHTLVKATENVIYVRFFSFVFHSIWSNLRNVMCPFLQSFCFVVSNKLLVLKLILHAYYYRNFFNLFNMKFPFSWILHISVFQNFSIYKYCSHLKNYRKIFTRETHIRRYYFNFSFYTYICILPSSWTRIILHMIKECFYQTFSFNNKNK